MLIVFGFGCGWSGGCLVGRGCSSCSSVVLLEEVFCGVFSFPPGVCIGALGLIASIPGPDRVYKKKSCSTQLRLKF